MPSAFLARKPIATKVGLSSPLLMRTPFSSTVAPKRAAAAAGGRSSTLSEMVPLLNSLTDSAWPSSA